MRNKKKYGFTSFVVDATLVCATGGLWGIRIFCREMRAK